MDIPQKFPFFWHSNDAAEEFLMPPIENNIVIFDLRFLWTGLKTSNLGSGFQKENNIYNKMLYVFSRN